MLCFGVAGPSAVVISSAFVGREGKQESHSEVEGFPRSRLLVFSTAHNFHEVIPKKLIQDSELDSSKI